MATRSRQHAFDHAAVDIGQPEVAARVAEGEAFVVEAEEVEDGRLQVVDMDGVHLGLEAELVRRAIDRATLYPAAREPRGEAVVVVVAAVDFALV